PDTKLCPFPLSSPEPVSDPSIEVLGRVLANGSCSITLNCTVERGDHVSYSWGNGDPGSSGLCSHNGSLLHLSYPLQNTSISCSCTASNPVSSRAGIFSSSECSHEPEGNVGLSLEQLVLLVLVPIATVVMLTVVFMVTHLAVPTAGQELEHPPLSEDSAVHTIYSQVQRAEKQRSPPTTEHISCTTIYAAATGLPPDMTLTPSRPPRSPNPTQQPLSQSPDKEPMTVYASVVLPMA
ncbi:SLAF1 protein, partial [Alcedo cyanopectus]|nr:SLAF1 protein [Ceyx cyanopectus]